MIFGFWFFGREFFSFFLLRMRRGSGSDVQRGGCLRLRISAIDDTISCWALNIPSPSIVFTVIVGSASTLAMNRETKPGYLADNLLDR